MKEKITIIIANYNNGRYLKECVDSVLKQTSDRWNIIIVNDASTDKSKEIHEEYVSNEKISIYNNKNNIGYIGTLKYLIELSQNDIIGILDPDDKLDTTTVEKVMDYYDKHIKTGFVYSNFWYCDEQLKIKKLGYSKPIPPGESNLNLNCVSAFRTFRKSYYKKTDGFDENLLYADDKDLVLKMEEVTHLGMVNEPLYFYRVLPNSQSHGEKRRISKTNFEIAKNNARKRRGLENPHNLFVKFKNINYKFWKKKKKKIPNLTTYKDVAIENLVNAKSILDNLKMTNWLTDGTLLGYYRDNGFISHDLDTDMGSFIKDYNDKVIMEFIENGWSCEHVFGKKDLGLELSFRRNHIKLDIFFFYEENCKFWHAAWLKTKRGFNLIRYYYDHFDLKEVDFYGYKFNVPKDTEKYIIKKYGNNWKIPIKKWDWAFDPKNSQKTSYFLNQ